MIKFGKQKKEIPHIEITSLIDIIFILLIFFMVSSTFLKPATRLRLPVAATREKVKEQNKIIVTLSADGDLYVERKLVSINEFQPLIREQVEKSSNVIVLFYGDEDISFKKFLLVMDVLKKSGIKGIAIGHEME